MFATFFFSADFQVKGGDTRCIHFSRTGSTRLAISPSKKTFTVAAGIGKCVKQVTGLPKETDLNEF